MGFFGKMFGTVTGANAHGAVMKKAGMKEAASKAASEAPKLGVQLLDAADVLAGAYLAKHPDTRGAAVLCRTVGGRRLGAFVVLAAAFALPLALFLFAGWRFAHGLHRSQLPPVQGTMNPGGLSAPGR